MPKYDRTPMLEKYNAGKVKFLLIKEREKERMQIKLILRNWKQEEESK